jgi:glyoxylase-like metal-dependent hydrolase (beta-lactamase superfamily II)
MTIFPIGGSQVEKIHELDLHGFAATSLLPGLAAEVPHQNPEWVPPGTYDAESHALLSFHTWLVRHEGHVILIDTGAGNGKKRPGLTVLDQLDTPYLAHLAAAGIRPADVNYILLTHIHADHVGWNTSKTDKGWVPTFPNATVICSALEWRYGAALAANDETMIRAIRKEAGIGEPIRVPEPGVFEDSMLPLQAGNRLRLVEVNGEEVLPGIRFISTAGHSIDHAAIQISSQGEMGIFGGDVLHHPLEIYDPELISSFCEFPDAARRTHDMLLRHLAETRALYFSSHFTRSSAGHVTANHGRYKWNFAEPKTRS